MSTLTEESDETRAQSLALQARLLEEYYNDLISRENILTRLLVENKNSVAALQGIDDTQDMQLAIPIGGGANLPVVFKASQKILLNISADVAIEKPKSEAIQYLLDRGKEINNALATTLQQKDETAKQINIVRDQLAQLEMSSGQRG
jgi:prefoldin subunit 5